MKRVRVTSPAGTDVVVSIERRPALEVVPVKQPGAMMGPAPLWGEVAYPAVEDQTNGTIVIDGNMLGIGIPRHVEHPITWHVEDGKYQAIEGGAEARRLLDVISGVPGTETMAEFAFGTSDFAPVGDPSEKGRKGTRALRPGRQPELLPGRPEQERPAPVSRICSDTLWHTPSRWGVHRQGRNLAAMSEVAVIALADVEPVPLAGGSWSRVLVAEQTVGGNVSALGYSVSGRSRWPARSSPGSATRTSPWATPASAGPTGAPSTSSARARRCATCVPRTSSASRSTTRTGT